MPTATPTGLWVRDAELDQRPPVVNWSVADAAARTALVSGAGLKQFDLAYQQDNGTVWLATNAPSSAPSSWLQLSGSTGAAGAPTNAPYVTLGLSSDLSQERVLAGESGVISITDGGANGNVTVALIDGGIQTVKLADQSVANAKLGDGSVGNTKFRQITARSVFGNPTASLANGQDITASTVGNVLRYSGTTIGFGTISLGDSGSVTVPGSNGSILYRSSGVVGSDGAYSITSDGLVVLTDIHLDGDLYLGRVSPSPIGTNQNNFTSITDSFCWRIEPTADVNITGLLTALPYQSIRGKIICLLNVSSAYSFTLVANSASSTDVNRFAFPSDLEVGPGEAAIIWYDMVVFRWKLIAHSLEPTAGTTAPPPFVLSNPTVASNEFDDETIAVIEPIGGGGTYDFANQGVYTVVNAKSSGTVVVGGGGSFPLVGGGVTLAVGEKIRAVAFSFGGAGNVAYRIDNASGAGASTTNLIEDTTEYFEPDQYNDELLAYDKSADAQYSVKMAHVVYPYNFRREWVCFNDFNNAGSGLNDGLSSTTSGTSAANTATASDGSAFGVNQSQTGSDTTGRAGFITGTGIIRLGDCVARYAHRLRINLGLSDGTNTYIIRSGFGDQGGGEPTDGVYYRYTHSESGGDWTCVCRSSGTETTADSATAPTTGTTWQLLEIVVGESGATTADFWIDGGWKAAISTNVPNGAGRETGVFATIIKSAGSGSRAFESDYIFASIRLNTPRLI